MCSPQKHSQYQSHRYPNLNVEPIQIKSMVQPLQLSTEWMHIWMGDHKIYALIIANELSIYCCYTTFTPIPSSFFTQTLWSVL